MMARTFVIGKMVLKAVDHMRWNLFAPSKFAPSWEGLYLVKEANDSGYYRLSTVDGEVLVEPINCKCLKMYYA